MRKARSSASSSTKVRMPNLLTLEDFKDKELDPNSTPLEVLAFVAEVALQKLEESKQAVETNSLTKENAKPNSPKKNDKPLKNKKRKSQLIEDELEIKASRLEIPNEKCRNQFTNKRKRRRDNSNAPPPPLSEEFQIRIIEKCGRSWPNQFTHFYEKELFESDVSKQHSRITMALNDMKSLPFLKKEEVTLLKKGGAIKVPVIHKPIDGPLTELTITFKQWDLHKKANCTQKISTQYVLNGGWYTIATKGKFKANHTVDIWAFRDLENKLCMAVARRE